MYKCYVCGLQAAKSVKLFQVCLYRHRDNGDLIMPIMCGQGNRKSASGSILSVESNQNMESKTKNVESKTEKCGVQNSIFTSRNQLF